MSPLEELLNRRWILKSEDSALYYKVKDALKDIRKTMQEKLGYIVIVNPYLIKLEKTPGKAEPWMGIQEFTSIREYQMFCFLLMYLEDKQRDFQFVLSSLTEYIQVQFPQGEIDWLQLHTRRQMIRVIKYAIAQGLIQHDDGDEDRFAQDVTSEVLYENTGISRYFMRNFTREIMEYAHPEEFEQSEWINMDEDRGIVRRQRIYRKLLLSPGVYRNDNDDDFAYIRNYRNQIASDMQSYLPCELHIHRSSAYLNLTEDCAIKSTFPYRNTISDCILLLHGEIRKNVKNYQWRLQNNEQIVLTQDEFQAFCERRIQKYIEQLPKQYQTDGKKLVANNVIKQMESFGFIERKEQEVILYPVAGKLIGAYREGGESDVCK